jgi:hypothetical protein
MSDAAFSRQRSMHTQSEEAVVTLRAGEHVMHCPQTCAHMHCIAIAAVHANLRDVKLDVSLRQTCSLLQIFA